MITRELDALPKRDVYRILTSLVIPRPIAWISTVDAAGRVNLAPFSSFMGVFGPPMLVVTLARRKDGSLKDTHQNLRTNREAVVHLADLPLVERLGLVTAPSLHVAPPRLVAAPVALECRLNREIELGPASTLVLLDVLTAHAADHIWNSEYDCADASLWRPITRLASVAGPNYGALGQTFKLGASELP